MSDERTARLHALFTAALDLAPGERSAFLQEACAGRSSLFRDATGLLAEHQAAEHEDFLAPPADRAPAQGGGGGCGLTPGTLLGDFEILEPVGRGGMSLVYRAYQRGLRRIVALKVILDGALATPAQRDRFRGEAEALARCPHPHIIQVFACGEYEGRAYLALEYAEGGNLARAFGETLQPPPEAATLVRTLAEAVASAHRRGIIHRDLKPANVLLTAEGLPKVGDFGLAKLLDGASGPTQTGELLGTPSYMAPEQVAGKPGDIGPAADIYALGAILYEALTGRPPFVGTTRLDTLDQVRAADPVPPRRLVPRIPRDLETICLKCLHKEPGRRYATADDLADDLRRFLADEPIRARPVGTVEGARKWVRRRPMVAALGAVATLLLAAAVAAVPWFHHRVRQAEAATTARNLVEHLGGMRIARVPELVAQLTPYRRWADPLLRQILATAPPESGPHLHASLALLPVDPGQVNNLTARLLQAEPEALLVLQASLKPYRAGITPRLWALVEGTAATPAKRFRAACALAEYDPVNPRWPPIAREVALHLVGENPLLLDEWAEALRNQHAILMPHLAESIEAEGRTGADLRTLANLYKLFAGDGPGAYDRLLQRLADTSPPNASEADRLATAKRQASVASALLLMGQDKAVWPLLRHTPDPTVRSYLIERLHQSGVDPGTLVTRLRREEDASIRRAIVLALGEYDPDRLLLADRQALLNELLELYRTDPDAGLHGALHWLLDRWGQTGPIRQIDGDMEGLPPAERRWLVNFQGQSFSVITAPANILPPPPTGTSPPRSRHRFALACKEVPAHRFRQFASRSRPAIAWNDPYASLSRQRGGPALGVLGDEAAAYCNWLSQREGIAEDQWCYRPEPAPDGSVAFVPVPRFWERTGFRLPTDEEWMYACAAGATTPYAYGYGRELLGSYGWWFGNADGHAWSVGLLKPNDLGLFDLYGNAFEHCENPCESPSEPSRVLCGGSFLVPSIAAVLTDRNLYPPRSRGQSVGFRPARTLVEEDPVGDPQSAAGR